MNVRILIDSTVDLPDSRAASFPIVPLTIHFGKEEYTDGVTITHAQFYQKLTMGGEMPTTSQATPEDFDRAFRPLVEAGDDVVAITISSRLSGTFQSAMITAEPYDGRVFVVDSCSVTIGAGILAQYAQQLVAQGMTAHAIFEKLLQVRDRIHLYACVDTLEYLCRGGRISKTAAIAGNLLSIKPILRVRDGVIDVIAKARGTRQANLQLMKEIENAGGADFSMPYLLGFTGMEDTLLKKFIESSASYWPDASVPYADIGSVVGTHAGPGAYAAAFFVR